MTVEDYGAFERRMAESGITILPPALRVFCPVHKAWESLVEDEGLCDYCCHPKPCPHDHDPQDVESDAETEEGTEEGVDLDDTMLIVEIPYID